MNGTIRDFAAGIVCVAATSFMVMPRRSSTQVINSLMGGNAAMIRAATSYVPVVDTRTPAERFHEEAMDAIAEFWSGFGDSYTGDF